MTSHYPNFITSLHPPIEATISRDSATASHSATVRWRVGPSGANPAAPEEFAGNTYPHGTVQFTIGETSKTISIQPSDYARDGRTFTVNLTGSGIDPDSRAVALEIPTYGDPVFSIARDWSSPPTPPEGRTRPPTRFTVTRHQVADAEGNVPAASVHWKAGITGRATASTADFDDGILPSGTLEFGTATGDPGELVVTRINLDIQPAEDSAPGRAFWVMVFNPSAGRVGYSPLAGQEYRPAEMALGQIHGGVGFGIATA